MAEGRAGSAVVRVTGGAGRFADLRERIRWLLVRDPDVDPYTEHHAPDRLEYRFTMDKGLPFPSFVSASAEFPELSIVATWDHGEGENRKQGGVMIEAGRPVEKWTGERATS